MCSKSEHFRHTEKSEVNTRHHVKALTGFTDAELTDLGGFGDDWPIPTGLSEQGRDAAKAIVEFLTENNITDHGGGGKFYTPREWRERGEEYGTNSLLIVTHDGGDHAVAFNWDYEQYELMEQLRERLSKIGVYVEQCTSWYSAVYPA